MGWGLKRLENLIQDPLENPTTFLLFDELRRIGSHIGLLMMIRSTSSFLVSAQRSSSCFFRCRFSNM
jgi:hypothetical protein